MTVVAAIARPGRVVFAADRQTNSQNQNVFGARKIRQFTAGGAPLILAATGSGALLNVLVQHLKLDEAPSLDGPLAALCDWADVVASAATEILAGTEPPLLAVDAGDQSRTIDGSLLLGYAGRLFYLFTHQSCYVPDGVASLGNGSEVALGAMHAALARHAAPEEAAVEAVRLACRFSPYCGLGPCDEPDVVQVGSP